MADDHEFGTEEAKRLAALYTTPAAIHRRQRVRDSVRLTPGDSVISIGCGPGFEAAELADIVGEDGHVLGVDLSEAMLELAEDRCSDLPQVSLKQASADELPVTSESYDAAVAVQVYSYVNEIESAMSELYRILRPGGRAAIYDGDTDSLVFHSREPVLMDRVIEAWGSVYANPHFGSQLTRYLREAGLSVTSVEPNSILNTSLDGTFAGYMVELLRSQLPESNRFEPGEVEAWATDLESLDETGETFFNLTQYLYSVQKPE